MGSPFETFKTKKAAQQKANEMREHGWPDAYVDRVYVSRTEDPAAMLSAPVARWVVGTNQNPNHSMYLRTSGYVE